MSEAANPAPGFAKHPGHKITTEPLGKTVRVTADGEIIARSSAALLLREGSYDPVVYIPFSDINFSKLEKTASSTFCPFKGDASYWKLAGTGEADVMWAYEHPYDEMLQITKHGAFYPGQVDIST